MKITVEHLRRIIRRELHVMIEARIREADITDGKAEWGSDAHVADLESRIEDLMRWRDKQRKGSEVRANYARLVSKLKSELKSARRQAAKRAATKKKRDDR